MSEPTARGLFRRFGHSPYEAFEHAIMLVLTALIVVIVAVATWHLVLEVVGLLFANQFSPANAEVFRDLFAMFFTVLIALEFKRSFLLVSVREESVVRVRSIILIGMLATVRRFIVLDIHQSDVFATMAVSAAMLSLGVVYWLVRDQEMKILRHRREGGEAPSDAHEVEH